MKSFSPEDIIEYYDMTKVHYRRAWDLSESRAMHYGYKLNPSDSFRESLHNMNQEMAAFANIQPYDEVLDAGCGVGGSSYYLADDLSCKVIGISLSEDQIQEAQKLQAEYLEVDVKFELGDFTNLKYQDNSFDVIWALESLVHSEQKDQFFSEAFRVLKPGGRVIIGEYIRNKIRFSTREEKLLKRWLNAWAIKDIETIESYRSLAQKHQFASFIERNIDKHIGSSSWRMFYGSWFLFVLSKGYKLFNPKVSRFADQHYKGMYYQYRCFKKQLWSYHLICIQKQ
jgi:cyclopropane fatty-acyl-phospholipid synthase-like methyltransferase